MIASSRLKSNDISHRGRQKKPGVRPKFWGRIAEGGNTGKKDLFPSDVDCRQEAERIGGCGSVYNAGSAAEKREKTKRGMREKIIQPEKRRGRSRGTSLGKARKN